MFLVEIKIQKQLTCSHVYGARRLHLFFRSVFIFNDFWSQSHVLIQSKQPLVTNAVNNESNNKDI